MNKLVPIVALLTLSTALPSLAQDQDYAAAGTKLPVGESAIVPYSIANGPEVPVELTITAIEEGEKADLEGFEIPADLESARPIYVRFTYTNLSEEDLSNKILGAFIGVDDRDQSHLPASAGSFDKCSTGIARDLTEGKSHEGCVMFMIHEGGHLAAAGYRGHTRDGEETPIYDDPILWEPAAEPAADATGADTSKGKVQTH